MDKEKQDKFNEKVSKYVAEGFFSEQEVNQKIGEIEGRIRCLGSESPKNKKNIEKELNSGEKVVKEIDEGDSNKKYVIRFFYNKKDNKLVLKNIFEYQRDDKTAYIVTDVIITLYTIIFTYCITFLNKNINVNFWPICILVLLGITLNAWTICWYLKEKNNRYEIVGQDWLDKLLLDLDSLGKIEKFRISRAILYFFLFLLYSSLLMNDSIHWYTFINLVCYVFSIWLFVVNLFKLTKLNFLYFVGIIFIALLTGSLQSTNWEAIVALIAIISLLFSDEIWKISPNYENPLEGKYQSKTNKKIVERNIFIYKLILSTISLVLFITLKLLGDRMLIGRLLLGDKVEELNTIASLMYKGLDRIVIAFLLFIAYLIIVWYRKRRLGKGKQFEKPIVDNIIKFIYKDLKNSSPKVKTSIEIDKDLEYIFEPKTLIENLDDLPDDIIVSMKKPVKSGENILFIQKSDGELLLKKKVQISFYKSR